MTTHLCCRDCPFEAVVSDTDADRTVATHENETGHTVDSGAFDGPKRLGGNSKAGIDQGALEAARSAGAHDEFIAFVAEYPDSAVAETLETAISLDALDNFPGHPGSFGGALWEHGAKQASNPDTENRRRIEELFDKDRWPTWMQEEASEDELATDGGRDTLRLTDDGIEIPDDVDFTDGIVFRARGATVDHKPGNTDRDFCPLFREHHLTAEDRSVVNEDLDEFEISIKPYGEEAKTYEVTPPATDGGLIEHPGLEAVAAEEYDGTQECDYGCGSVAEYCVELRLEASSTTSLVCDDCSQEHKLWLQENGLLEETAYVDPLAKIAGQTEVEITCAIALDAPDACDGWTETVELDGPARCVNGRIKLPGFDWECPECGNPSEFEVDGTRVSTHV